MDILAEKLNMDPIEFRLKNVFKKGGKTATGQVLLESIPVDRCLEEMVSYSKEYKKIKDEANQNPMKKRGLGVAASYYGTGYGNGFPDISRATVRLLEDSKIGVFVGATEVGQGAKTAMIQIVAETLKINEADVKLVSEDTKYMLDSGNAPATRKTYNTSIAVKIACEVFLLDLIV